VYNVHHIAGVSCAQRCTYHSLTSFTGKTVRNAWEKVKIKTQGWMLFKEAREKGKISEGRYRISLRMASDRR